MLPEPSNPQIEIRATRLRLTGELDMETADLFLVAAERLVVAGHHDVTVDCAGVTFCDSYGLRALERVADLVGPDGSVAIAGPSPTLTRILDISGIAHLFKIAAPEPSLRS